MKEHRNNLGFSLTEMLIATGIMAIGLVMVSTIFPVGVKLTTLTTERTVGSVVADEAFAKIQLYGLRDFRYWPAAQLAFAAGATKAQAELATSDTCADFQFNAEWLHTSGFDGVFDTSDDGFTNFLSTWSDFLYPSTPLPAGQDHNYHWSALCRRISNKQVQVTVFVTRKFSSAARFRSWDFNPVAVPPTYSALANSPWPKPVPVNVGYNAAYPNTLFIDSSVDPQVVQGFVGFSVADCLSFFDDGFTIVDDLTGEKYRVLEVKDVNGDGNRDIVLYKDWQPNPINPTVGTIWVVPPAVGSDRYPCVGVYQRIIRFDEIQ